MVLPSFEGHSDLASAVSTEGITVSSVGKIVNLNGVVISVLYGKPVIDDDGAVWNVNAFLSLLSFKKEADEGILEPCDDVKTLCRLAERRMANLSFRIVATFLILSSVVHLMDFWAFLDAGKTLPSSEPIRSTPGENKSAVFDIWTGDLCCGERSGTSACLAEGFLNPITSLEDSAIRWFGSSANLRT